MTYPIKNEDILRTRTSKIIGGYLTEYYFCKRFLQNREYSRDWWVIVSKTDKTTSFIVTKEVLNSVDKEVFEKLTKGGYKCYQLYKSSENYVISDGEKIYSIDDFIKLNGLICNDYLDKKIISNDTELEKCINRYKQLGLIDEIAKSIYLEDHFLNKYFYTSNIDIISRRKDGKIFCGEIKFKNEFKNTKIKPAKLVFGIDIFQYDNVFKPFLKSDMIVYNIILYNDKKTKHNTRTTNIFDYEKTTNEKDFIWKYKQILLEDNLQTYSFDNTYTSWNGNKGREVYTIPIKEYKSFSNNYEADKYWGKCNKGNGYRTVRENRKTKEEFMGCTCWKSHN